MALSLLATSFLVTAAHAATHQILMGSNTGAYIYALEYDDSTKTLRELTTTTAAESHQWLSLSHDKKVLYGSAGNGTTGMTVSSYTIESAESIIHKSTTAANSASDATAGSVYVEASPAEPYSVYAVSYKDIDGGVAAVDETGVTTEEVQGFQFANESSLHGVRVHPSGDYLYTADMGPEMLWTHKIDRTTGAVTFVSAEATENGQARHVEISLSGKYAYVITEDTSKVVAYDINNSTGAATYSGIAYDIVPDDAAGTHRGETVRLSATGTLLYATTRANKSDANALDGYVSCFTLDTEGAIVSQDFIEPTTTGGGSSNMVVPAIWDDNLFGVLDAINGTFVMYERAADGASASAFTSIAVGGGDSGLANGQWLS